MPQKEVFVKIAFVGAGNIGESLAKALLLSGFNVSGIYDIDPSKALLVAERLGVVSFGAIQNNKLDCDVVFLTVPDRELSKLCSELVDTGRLRTGMVVLHTSGAFSSQELSAASDIGCFAGSFHPLQTFPDAQTGHLNFINAYVAIEGDNVAKEVCLQIVRSLGCLPLQIPVDMKSLYHAAACMASNYMVAVVDTAINWLVSSGVKPSDALPALKPLLTTTLQNILNHDTEKALTGPISRGDIPTVQGHILALKHKLPNQVNLYKMLGEVCVDIADRRKTITNEQKQGLVQIFEQPTL
ncbi:MAG TPA: hypothetical protein DCM62_10495 [Bacteroidales bacterium]|nr:hypothetical protein [Bacteroidales bacterium]